MTKLILTALSLTLAVGAGACIDRSERDTTVPGQERDTPGGAGLPRGAPPGTPGPAPAHAFDRMSSDPASRSVDPPAASDPR